MAKPEASARGRFRFMDGADLDRVAAAYEAGDPDGAARIGAEAGGDSGAPESNGVEAAAESAEPEGERTLDERARDVLAQAGTAALPRRRDSEPTATRAPAAPVQLPEPLAVSQQRGRAEAVPANIDASQDEVKQARERAEGFGRRALKLAAAGALDPDSDDAADVIAYFGDLAAARYRVRRPAGRAKA